ncbi:MAG TPA: hypothetical protein VHC22_08280 [Pirellulales bacterium]|nr:hypothetical protein [Pirellulales bacterium]
MTAVLDKPVVLPWLLTGLYLAGASLVAGMIHFDVGGVPAAVVFDSLVYAGAALVGMWAGLGRHSKIAGFAGVGSSLLVIVALVGGSLWHSISGPMGPGNDFWVTVLLVLFQLALATLSMAIVVAAMVYLRQQGVVLAAEPTSGDELQPVRFSLRQLMLGMVVVGVMLKLGPITRARFNDYHSYSSSVVALGSGGILLGAVALAGLWGVFGGPPSIVRMVAALVVAGILGLLPPYYFPELLTDEVGPSVAATMLESLLVMATLTAVRVAGYRLTKPV